MHSILLGKQIELTDPYWYVQTYREIFRRQIYRFQTTSLHPRIIDCGANIGLSVLYFKWLYPNAEVLAFEPDPVLFQVLQRNVNKAAPSGVTLVQKAIWIDETEVPFLPDGSVGGRLINEANDSEAVYVKTVRLRDLLNGRVDLLKMDIEGAEHEVVADCRDRLGYVDRLFVEYHGGARDQQTLHKMLEILQEAGFRYHIKEANPILHPFIERNPFYDLQLNIYCFRVQ
jgi:FkbM family methyltransferase